MSQLEVKALETHFEVFKSERYPSLPISEAFERFGIVQVLKDEDLSDDEIESGILGGGDDGGIDGLYFFVNRVLVQDESDLPEEAITDRSRADGTVLEVAGPRCHLPEQSGGARCGAMQFRIARTTTRAEGITSK